MAGAPQIVPYTTAHHPALMELLRAHFGPWASRRLERRWRWQFETNPFVAQRPSQVLLLEDEGRIVGHISGIPTPLRVGDRSDVALTLSAFVADERSRMSAAVLMRRMTQQPPVLTSGMNEGAYKIFSTLGGVFLPATRQLWTLRRRYAGQITSRLRRRLSRSLAPRLSPRLVEPLEAVLRGLAVEPPLALPPLVERLEVQPITRFDGAWDAFWARVSPRFEACVERSAQYMNWRYVDCPTQNAIRLGLFDGTGQLEGVAVGVVRGDRDWTGEPCATHGMVAELVMRERNQEAAYALLLSLVHALDARRVDTIEAIGLGAEYSDALSRLGFSPCEVSTFAVGVKAAPDAGRAIDKRRWYATAGDGDCLYAPVL